MKRIRILIFLIVYFTFINIFFANYAKSQDTIEQALKEQINKITNFVENQNTSSIQINTLNTNINTDTISLLNHHIEKLNTKLKLQYDSNDVELLLNLYDTLAKYHILNKNYDEAINICKEGLKFNNQFIQFYYNLAECFFQKENYNEAILNYKYALNLNPIDLSTNLKIAECYFKLNNYDEAEKILVELLKLYPNNNEIIFNLGSIYYKKQNLNQAINYWLQVINNDPNSKFAQIANEWLKQLNIPIEVKDETIECKLAKISFIKPHSYFMSNFEETSENFLCMLNKNIYDFENKTTVSVSISIIIQPSMSLDLKQLAKNWQNKQLETSNKFELLSEKEMILPNLNLPMITWEYKTIYENLEMQGITAICIKNSNIILIWLNSTVSLYHKTYKDFEKILYSISNL